MVLLICLSFVGQAMASTIMSYHMMGMAGMSGMKSMSSQVEVQSLSQNMSMMDHSNHNMASESDDSLTDSTDATEECCNKICNCFAGGCSSIAALIKHVSNSPILDNSAKILSHSRLALSQKLTSLYRPPILS